MTTTHTPGPLAASATIVDQYKGDRGQVVIEGTDCKVADTYGPRGEASGNAILFAAAPEMLEALEALARYVPRSGISDGVTPLHRALYLADTAIAKARGE